MKPLLLFILLLAVTFAIIFLLGTTELPKYQTNSQKEKPAPSEPNTSKLRLKQFAARGKAFAQQKGFSLRYQFLIDMKLPSGKKRFFIYDAFKDSTVNAGLVAHGSCRTNFLAEPIFSNLPDCGCSSVGKYKIGGAYEGRFGRSFTLHGLDSSNSNAFKRTVVLHPYNCVPDEEVEPYSICNSLGCPMVSYKFLNTVASIIDGSEKPILLWIFN